MKPITASLNRCLAVPGDHVTGTGDLHDLGVRDKAAQFRHAFLAHHVAAVTTHEQRWHPDVAGGGEPCTFIRQPSLPSCREAAVQA